MAAVFILLAIVLMIGVIRGQSALIMLTSLLIVTALGSTWWSRRSSQRLTYRRWFEPPRIFPGEHTDYVVEISNRKFLPLPWVRLDEHMPSPVVPVRGGPAVAGEEGWQRRRSVSLGWHERLVLRQRFTCSQRGDYLVGPTEIETGDPLALFPQRLRIPETHELLVYPRVAALPPFVFHSRFPYGSANARPPTLEDPMRFAGIRDYRPGDPRRFLDWKASARRMQLQTRVFAPTTLHNIVIALNVQTMAFAWQGYDQERFDAAVGVAAAMVREVLAARQQVGLAANASGPGLEEFQLFLRPNRRPSQLEEAFGALATIAPIPTMAFGPFLRRIAASFPYGASLAAVTAFLDYEIAAALARLVDHGHAVSLVFLGSALPASVDPRIQTSLVPEVQFEAVEVR